MNPKKNGDKILIYSKTNPEVSREIKNRLDKRGFEYVEIVCGNYVPEQYKRALLESNLAIFVSKTETQGLAIFEAWSCNVPSFHFDPGVWNYQGHTYEKSSSCPYLNDQLGMRFNGMEEFDSKLDQVLQNLDNFTPREIVENNFTIDHSMKILSNILES